MGVAWDCMLVVDVGLSMYVLIVCDFVYDVVWYGMFLCFRDVLYVLRL